MQVIVGIQKLSSGGKRHQAKYSIIHENYDVPKFSHDIALIRVQTPIVFNEKVQPITYSTIEVPEKTELQVFGFGKLAVEYFIVNFVYGIYLIFLSFFFFFL